MSLEAEFMVLAGGRGEPAAGASTLVLQAARAATSTRHGAKGASRRTDMGGTVGALLSAVHPHGGRGRTEGAQGELPGRTKGLSPSAEPAIEDRARSVRPKKQAAEFPCSLLVYAPLSLLAPYGLCPSILLEAEGLGISAAELGRIVADHKGGCRVVTEAGEVLAVSRGKLSRASEGRPTVGDWVVLADAGAGGDRVITRVLTRRTALVRKSAGRETVPQVLATNVDVALIVCALGRDVNRRRIERLSTLARNGGVRAVVVLTKADTCDDPAPFVAMAREAAPDCPVHVVSALTGLGLAALSECFADGATVTLLGTSGAGKSTLVNHWLGRAVQSTGEVQDDGRGRHTTTSRQLHLLPTGGVVVDTPGLREVALWAGEGGLDATFDDIEALAPGCRFGNCGHASEPDCAVRAAVLAGTLDRARHESYLALREELAGAAKNLEAAERAARARERVVNRAVAARLQRGRR